MLRSPTRKEGRKMFLEGVRGSCVILIPRKDLREEVTGELRLNDEKGQARNSPVGQRDEGKVLFQLYREGSGGRHQDYS